MIIQLDRCKKVSTVNKGLLNKSFCSHFWVNVLCGHITPVPLVILVNKFLSLFLLTSDTSLILLIYLYQKACLKMLSIQSKYFP